MLSYNLSRVLKTQTYSPGLAEEFNFLPFLLCSIGEFRCGEEYYTERSGYESCLVIYTVSGSGSVIYRGAKHIVGAGDIFILNCREYHRYQTLTGCRWHIKWLHLKGAEDYSDAINSGSLSVVRGHFEAKLDSLLELVRQREADILPEASVMLHDLLRLMYTRSRTRAKDPDEVIIACINYMKEHFADELSVEELARRHSLSKYYFIRRFRKHTGIPPYEFLIRLRLDRARDLLVSTGENIEKIASECGFSDAKGLIVQFKKRHGTTPLKYRKDFPFWSYSL